MPPKKRTSESTKKGPPEYWIVNPKGTVHLTTKEDAVRRLQSPGWRMATAAEIKKAKTPNRTLPGGKKVVIQTFDDPFGEAYKPEELVEIEPEAWEPEDEGEPAEAEPEE